MLPTSLLVKVPVATCSMLHTSLLGCIKQGRFIAGLREQVPVKTVTHFGEAALPALLYSFRFLSLGQTLSTFHYTLLDKYRALLSVVERGWPNALDFSLDLELNIPQMHYLMNESFMECFVHYLMNSNCACVRSTTLDNFALDQTSLDKLQSSQLHSTRWPNALDISLNMHVERCIVKSRERLARALKCIDLASNVLYCIPMMNCLTATWVLRPVSLFFMPYHNSLSLKIWAWL